MCYSVRRIALYINLIFCSFYTQGKDDLRQDAVMQQVFGMVNELLQREPETQKRRLTVRTYKVRMVI